MFVDESKDAEVRIIDFGLSQKFAANQHLHDAVGTVYVLCTKKHAWIDERSLSFTPFVHMKLTLQSRFYLLHA